MNLHIFQICLIFCIVQILFYFLLLFYLSVVNHLFFLVKKSMGQKVIFCICCFRLEECRELLEKKSPLFSPYFISFSFSLFYSFCHKAQLTNFPPNFPPKYIMSLQSYADFSVTGVNYKDSFNCVMGFHMIK